MCRPASKILDFRFPVPSLQLGVLGHVIEDLAVAARTLRLQHAEDICACSVVEVQRSQDGFGYRERVHAAISLRTVRWTKQIIEFLNEPLLCKACHHIWRDGRDEFVV